MATTVDIHDLVKNYGKTRALDGLHLRVERGEVHGFLGPNGSGKTTTIRVLLGLLRASGGDARLFGQDPWKHAVELHKRLAYVPGDVHLWPSLTGGQAIDVLGRMRGGLERKRVDAMLERFALDPTKKSRTYSKGNRQKVALVAALASTAELLILDEPTSGLDPLMETIFQDCISEAKTDGRTVLLSSHILAEVEALCDRVSIIRRGKTVQSGSLAELRHLTRTSVSANTKRTVTGIADKPGIHNYVADGRHVRFDVEGQHLDKTMSALAKFGIHSLTSQPPTLEELFLRQYGEDLPAADRETTEASRGRRQ